MAALKKYQWPGNIRELENLIERSFIIESKEEIQLSSLPDPVHQASPTHVTSAVTPHMSLSSNSSGNYDGPLNFDLFKEQLEKDFIINALRANKGKINQTVAHANIPKNTLLRKIKKYGINPEDFKD